MRFLADESCDFSVVRALRDAGYDVVAVSEISPRAEDPDVLELTIKEKRILLTEDKDFGQLVFADRKATQGVILLRFPAPIRSKLPGSVLKILKDFAERIVGRFIVIQPGRYRIAGNRRD